METAPRPAFHEPDDVARALRLARELTRAIGEAETVDEAFERALRQLCEETGGVLGQAWLPTDDGDRLDLRSRWYARPGDWEAFRRASESIAYRPGVGLPGRAWASGRPEWAIDLDDPERFPRAPAAREAGIATGMAVPVVAEDQVVAVFEVFWTEYRTEDRLLLDLVSTVAGQLGSLLLRRRAEEALRDREDRFRTLAESTPDAIVSADAEGRITYFNPAAERIFGYASEEVAGKPLTLLMPARFREAHLEGVARLLAGGAPRLMGRTAEVAGRRRDGTEFPCEISVAASCARCDTFFTATMRDVTERRRTEVRAAEAERLARLGSWELDLTTREFACSPELFAIVGADPDAHEPTLELFMDRVHPDDRPRIDRLVERALRGERPPEALLHRLLRLDGETRIAEMRTEAVTDAEGRAVRIRGTTQDITERHHAEAALRESEAKFRSLLEFAPEATVGVGPDGRIALVNARVESLFGYRRHELVGRPVETLVAAPGDGLVAQRFREAQQNDRAGSARVEDWPGELFELSGRRRDGAEFPIELSLSRLETAEGTLVLSTIHDISERVRMQEEREELRARLHQTQRLESVGLLAGGIAHDFNNLLAVILNYSGFVLEDLDQGGDVRQNVEEIRLAAERAAGLTRQLLIFSRRDVVQPQVIAVEDVLSGMEELLRRTIGENVALVVSAPAGLPPVRGDRGQIEQVVVNLAVNARDAMSGGGTLTIELAEAELEAQPGVEVPPGTYLRLSVTDTGQGMDPEVRARAFEPFFTTKPKGKGTGLGLATVFGIVTEAGGHLEIESRPGAGTTVHVYLPPADGPLTAAVARHRNGGGRSRGETVLVVEDEDVVRRLTTRILTAAGYRVLEAPCATEALAACERQGWGIDLLLTDVVMPQMSGAELAERVRERRPAAPPKVLFMSGYPEDFMTSGDGLDGEALIEKPFHGEALLAKVREVLAADRAARAAGRAPAELPPADGAA